MSYKNSSAVSRPVSSNVGSQSLFNIYYLGQTGVDRRCTSSIMPWIIEELKLKAEEMKFIWLSPGQDDVSFVADNGKELFGHSYGSILQCCLAMDGISFAYIARQEKDKYVCHVFQAFNYDEAAKIMAHFKQHAKEEIPIHSSISDSSHPPSPVAGDTIMSRSSAYVMSLNGDGVDIGAAGSRSSGKPPVQGDTYKLVYLGKSKIPSSVTTGSDQVKIIDTLVVKAREALAARSNVQGKQGPRKKSIGSRLRGRNTKSSPPISRTQSFGKSSPPISRTQSFGKSSPPISRTQSFGKSSPPISKTQSFGKSSPVKRVRSSSDGEQGDMEKQEEDRGHNISLLPPGKAEEALSKSAMLNGNRRKVRDEVDVAASVSASSSRVSRTLDNGEFDTIPELGNLQRSLEFQALSGMHNEDHMNTVDKNTVNIKVQLNFTGVHVVVVAEETSEVLFKKSIKTIACCAQGKKEGEYLAFTCREGENDHVCYLFVARNSRTAVKILDSFKAAFVHALSLRMPPATCEYCPMNKIEQLCKNLEGVSTQVAQSILQESLEELSEADYSKIMQHYKVSEHADHEYTQIIVLVALLRQHSQRLQDKHTHRGLVTSKVGARLTGQRTGVSTTKAGDGGGEGVVDTKLKVPAIARAKNMIANSFENLRSKPQALAEKPKKTSSTALVTKPNAQSLFSRKSSIDTLMSPVRSKSSSVDEDMNKEKRLQAKRDAEGRTRSWTSCTGLLPPKLILDSEEFETEKVADEEEPDNVETIRIDEPVGCHEGAMTSHYALPKTPQGQRTRSLREAVQSRYLSLTPPSTSTSEGLFSKQHRRAVSHEMGSSWRQDIFESVVTPGKLEKGHRRTTTSADILDDFEIIELSPANGKGEREAYTVRQTQDKQLPEVSTARRRWQSAIHQQIVLIRMDKENQWIKVTGRNKLKLYYENAVGDSDPAHVVWRHLLDGSSDSSSIPSAILGGVPGTCREEVWQWLSGQYQEAHNPDWTFPENLKGQTAFQALSHVTTEYEHSIAVDIGRTFPAHPYFHSSLQEAGQADLHRILRAYAAADRETGYCQGLSFVTGIILVHTKDECSAFAMLYKLMNLHGYKEIYKGSLAHLQVRLYQLSRLIHDFIPSLHELLHVHEVTPFFYAAPWFLTIFASQYPISFAARVFDLIFYEGTEVLFKVALALLTSHTSKLVSCESMESICHYIKTRLPAHMEDTGEQTAILKQAMAMPDLLGRLRLFEAEYELLNELHSRLTADEVHLAELEDVREQMDRTNKTMVEQLAICHGAISSLQQQVQSLTEQLSKQQGTIARFEAQSSTTPTAQS